MLTKIHTSELAQTKNDGDDYENEGDSPSFSFFILTSEVERIIDVREKDGVIEYLLKWTGYSENENTWEPAVNLHQNCAHLIEEFDVRKIDEAKVAADDTSLQCSG